MTLTKNYKLVLSWRNSLLMACIVSVGMFVRVGVFFLLSCIGPFTRHENRRSPGRVPMKRIALRLAAAVVCLSLAWVSPHDAEAFQLTWGTLTTNSGPLIADWDVPGWINQFFEDGSKLNDQVSSNIVVVGTTSYFGDFIDNFNNTTGEAVGGAAFDTVA